MPLVAKLLFFGGLRFSAQLWVVVLALVVFQCVGIVLLFPLLTYSLNWFLVLNWATVSKIRPSVFSDSEVYPLNLAFASVQGAHPPEGGRCSECKATWVWIRASLAWFFEVTYGLIGVAH